MGKPAARIGDMTSHGGSIVVGQPNVLIGGMPAARATDMHSCPMVNGPQPHVGGPITMGSPGVLIGGMPAARQGDMATCAGPPDTIVMGCPTVLIGAVSPGSAGAAGTAGGGGAAAAKASAATAQQGAGEATTKEEHWVEFQFVDAAGLPVSGVPYTFADPDGNESTGTLRGDGTVREDALSQGQGEVVLQDVYAAEWGKNEARPDEEVTFSAKAEGFESGTPATVQVLERDISGPDVVVEEIEAEVKGEKVEGEWTYVYPEQQGEDGGGASSSAYSAGQYYVEVTVGSCTTRSGMLEYKDWLEVKLLGERDKDVAGAKYVLTLSNGEVRKGTLGPDGTKREENLPPATHTVRFPDYSSAQQALSSESE
jgi:uncharacterized Zn-binding protein involved in type VI secretion